MLEEYQQQGGSMDQVPPELTELLKNVKRSRQQPTPEDAPTEEITPVAGPSFLIDTGVSFLVCREKGYAAGRKVFINLCGSDRVAAPGNWVGGVIPDEVLEALDNTANLSEQQQNMLRFPLALGPAQMDLDKKSEPCTTYDVIVNHDIIKQAVICRPLKSFLIITTLQWVSHKTKSELSEKYKLPKMRYKGDVIQSQRIRVDKKALVTEICTVEEIDEEPSFPLLTKRLPAPATPPAVASVPSPSAASEDDESQRRGRGAAFGVGGASPSGPAVQHVLTPVVQYVGRPVTRVDITIPLPPLLQQTVVVQAPATAAAVSVSARSVRVSIAGCAELLIPLPVAVTHRSALAVLDANCGSVVLQLPYLPLAVLVEELRKEQPHGKGELKLADTSYMELEL
ncbi:MAG: hypothetical protein WDW38_009297 [Sanguina aurantia]